MKKNYWLIKSEPSSYSIEDFKRDKTTLWEGVRNYQARNFMRDEMEKGDLALFYHSSTEVPGVYGVAEIISDPLPDMTQFAPKSPYFDEKATKTKPTWMLRRFKYLMTLKNPVTLEDIRKNKALLGILVARKGTRLSVQPVKMAHFKAILREGSK